MTAREPSARFTVITTTPGESRDTGQRAFPECGTPRSCHDSRGTDIVRNSSEYFLCGAMAMPTGRW
ncbi:hypothetical protein ACWEVD_30000 [Nocardia thailandica]